MVYISVLAGSCVSVAFAIFAFATGRRGGFRPLICFSTYDPNFSVALNIFMACINCGFMYLYNVLLYKIMLRYFLFLLQRRCLGPGNDSSAVSSGTSGYILLHEDSTNAVWTTVWNFRFACAESEVLFVSPTECGSLEVNPLFTPALKATNNYTTFLVLITTRWSIYCFRFKTVMFSNFIIK
jgi:hypothetical protein